MDILTLGELLIDMFPGKVGQRMGEVESFHPKPGGAPANVAVAARRLGAQTAFIGKVGDDLFGHFLRDVLAGEGIETKGLRFDAEARTTMAIIAMPDEQSAEFVFYRNPGADQRLRVDELDIALLEGTRAFHFGSLSLTDEPVRSATHEAVRIARQKGALISYDVNYRPSLWKEPRQALEQALKMLPMVDLLKVNEVEVALLSESDPIDPTDFPSLEKAACSLLEMGPQLVVVTLGKDGSYFQSDSGGEYVSAFRVETIDAVGCGDAFVAGLLTRLVQEGDWRKKLTPDQLREVLTFSNAVGAMTSLKRGVIPALPTFQEVEKFLVEYQEKR
jgi:fructokinase